MNVRTRKTYSPSRRKQVALNRLLGACIQCRVRKGSVSITLLEVDSGMPINLFQCNFGIPCDECIKRAGSVGLGQQLCGRQKLLTTRFNNVGESLSLERYEAYSYNTDFLGVTRFGERLETLAPILGGLQREIGISWSNCCTSEPNITFKVQVQDIKDEQPLVFCGRHIQLMIHTSYNGCSDAIQTDSPCAIVPHSMPSLSKLESCKIDSEHCCHIRPFAGLHIAFANFAHRYCMLELPLVSPNDVKFRAAFLMRNRQA